MVSVGTMQQVLSGRVSIKNLYRRRSQTREALQYLGMPRWVIRHRGLESRGVVQPWSEKVCLNIQSSSNWRAPGLVNFVLAVAYYFWLNLPAAFTEPGARLLEEPCSLQKVLWVWWRQWGRVVPVSNSRQHTCLPTLQAVPIGLGHEMRLIWYS